jgi:hypothetical protein
MITSILEFLFTNHYYTDDDNRFLYRVKNAKLLNTFNDLNLANRRFKNAMYSMALGQLDNKSYALSPIAITFGNIYFREGGKLQAANIEIDKGIQGNVYVAIIKGGEVVTLLLMPLNTTNQQIADKIKDHDGTEIKELLDLKTLSALNLSDKKRSTVIIDLDIPEIDFVKEFPAPQLKNNPWNISSTGLSEAEIEEIDRMAKLKPAPAPTFSIHAIDADKIAEVKDLIKEYTIAEGQTILIPYPDGPKEKVIRKIVLDETGDNRKYYLEFEKTAKLFDLSAGTNFIISPKVKNDKYRKLLKMFNLSDDQFMNFQGKITSMSYYKGSRFSDGKHRLGILIDPKFYF